VGLLSPLSGASAKKATEVAHFECDGCSMKHTAAIVANEVAGTVYYKVFHKCFAQPSSSPNGMQSTSLNRLVNGAPNRKGFVCKLVGSKEAW
jgi:hypothetical protein